MPTSKPTKPLPTSYGKQPATAQADKGELGDSQGMLMNGIVLNSEYRQDLRGVRGVKTFREMMASDGTVQQAVQICTLPIRSLNWTLQPFSDKSQDVEIYEFVLDVFANMERTFDDYLMEMLLHLPLGRYLHELVYDFDRPDGKIGLIKLAARPPETLWEWHVEAPEPYITQRTIHGQYKIPFDKGILMVNQQEGYNFEGTSILRAAFPHWYIKNKLYIIDAMSAERQGLGIPQAEIPVGSTQDQKNDIINLLQELRANEKGYITYPATWKVAFMDMMAKTLKDLMPSASHHDQQIMKSILAAFMELGVARGATGSYALSENNSQFFIMSLEATRDRMKNILNKQLIKRLVDINFVTTDYPYFVTDSLNKIDVSSLSTAVQNFVTSTALSITPDVESMARKALELPQKSDSQDIDPSMADPMIKELQGEMNGLHTTMGNALAPGLKQNSTEPEQANPLDPAQQQQEAEKAGWTNADWYEAAVDLGLYKADGETPPAPDNPDDPPRVDDVMKQEIIKHFSPNVPYKKHKEYVNISADVTKFGNNTRQMLLDKLAKNQQVTPQQSAQVQLDIFKKKSALSTRINNLKNDVHLLKHQDPPKPVKVDTDPLVDDKDKEIPADKKKKAAEKIREQKDKVDVIIERLEHELTANTQ